MKGHLLAREYLLGHTWWGGIEDDCNGDGDGGGDGGGYGDVDGDGDGGGYGDGDAPARGGEEMEQEVRSGEQAQECSSWPDYIENHKIIMRLFLKSWHYHVWEYIENHKIILMRICKRLWNYYVTTLQFIVIKPQGHCKSSELQSRM